MMVPFEKALEIVMDSVRVLDAEQVDLGQALNRILAEDVHADLDMPPFDKSAMDGYACRRADLDGELAVIETIQAGYVPTKAVGKGQCSKIMTGAMIPEGADSVIMIEYTESVGADKVRFAGKQTRDNICYRGEDVRAGAIVLRKGDRIAPQHIAVLATVGRVRPNVARRPRVGVIATGDELVEPSVQPGPSQIRTSNSYQLCAQVTATGSFPTYYGIVKDTESAIDAALKRAQSENDVVILSGGVSMGDFDLVPQVMAQNNFRILFDSIAMKPGKPTTFGVSPDAYCFGLPGNPVSTFVQFEILLKPFLYALMGHRFHAPHVVAPLAESIQPKKTERESWIPVALTDTGEVRAIDFHGSAHINALCRADGLLVIPAGTTSIEKGMLVRVRSI